MEDLKNAFAEKKVIRGFREVKTALCNGKIARIYVTSNCPQKYKTELKNLAKLENIDVTELDMNSEQLMTQLKLGFKSSVLGIAKAE
jgi:ribosomal protein L30E